MELSPLLHHASKEIMTSATLCAACSCDIDKNMMFRALLTQVGHHVHT